MTQTEKLMALAHEACKSLSEHMVLKDYWDHISLILKGSTARGVTDQLSDIDLIFYCKREYMDEIIQKYYKLGLINRTDGIFLPLTGFPGHYNFDDIEKLRGFFLHKDYPMIWECQNAYPLHDPDNQFRDIVEEGCKNLFPDHLAIVKRMYLDMQLQYDWMRHPTKRADKIASVLHGSTVLRFICRLAYILDAKPYPHDKWISYYLETTAFGKAHKQQIVEYSSLLSQGGDAGKYLEADQYPQYRVAGDLVHHIKKAIAGKFGEQPWIEQWYLFV